jgi:hypothetical protein
MEPWIALVALGLQTVVFLGGGWVMVLRNNWSTQALEKGQIAMQEELKKLAEVITNQAVQSVRLDNQGSQIVLLQKEISDLRRGDGWIKGKPRGGVNGEYP